MSHNGHNPNDLIAARIVAGAMQASKLPPAAARAVFRALNTAGIQPPAPTPAPAPARSPSVGGEDPVQRLIELAAGRVGRQQEALVLDLVRERLGEQGEEVVMGLPALGDRLQGFDYLPTEAAEGYREYELDGRPLVRFYSPEVAFDGDSMLVNLRYRIPT